MVLQRNAPVPVWGKAAAAESISVAFRGQTKSTKAGADGKWIVALDPTAAGGPFDLIVAGRNTLTLTDVMVGEVWICSGQSNMQHTIAFFGAANLDSIKSADIPDLRLMSTYASRKWHKCTPDSVLDFSATAFYFGRELQRALKIPVGIIASAVGGTPVERWMDSATLAADPVLANDTGTHGGDLYRNNILPLVPFAIKGFAWYQGESNAVATWADHPNWTVGNYGTHFKAMIQGWRRVFGQGDLPFYYVQLANYLRMQTNPGEVSAWAELREAQRLALAAKNTSMAVAIDVGDSVDIHPKDKWDVGKRLALPALAKLYGKNDLVCSGPMYESMRIKDKTIRLKFSYADGLKSRDGGKLAGFAIAGTDGKWTWADAVIDKDTVIASSATVAAPTQVRYGWANNPNCNLYNAAGLPASPFKTDGAQLPVALRRVETYFRNAGNAANTESAATEAASAWKDALGRRPGNGSVPGSAGFTSKGIFFPIPAR
jgi:sialate O-acetylesterase